MIGLAILIFLTAAALTALPLEFDNGQTIESRARAMLSGHGRAYRSDAMWDRW
jgi:hypothetical protein